MSRHGKEGLAEEARRPAYRRLHGSLRAEIAAGQLAEGAELPSEAELATRFSVSRITVRHALQLLELDGYIRKARARRSVVVSAHPEARAGWRMESLDDMLALVRGVELRVESWGVEPAGEAAGSLGLPAGAGLWCLRSTLAREGRARARSIIHFPPAIGARLTRAMFDDNVVFRVLARELGIDIGDVKLTIWADLADTADAATLAVRLGAAILATRLLYRDAGGRAVEVAVSRYAAEDFRLTYGLTMGG